MSMPVFAAVGFTALHLGIILVNTYLMVLHRNARIAASLHPATIVIFWSIRIVNMLLLFSLFWLAITYAGFYGGVVTRMTLYDVTVVVRLIALLGIIGLSVLFASWRMHKEIIRNAPRRTIRQQETVLHAVLGHYEQYFFLHKRTWLHRLFLGISFATPLGWAFVLPLFLEEWLVRTYLRRHIE